MAFAFSLALCISFLMVFFRPFSSIKFFKAFSENSLLLFSLDWVEWSGLNCSCCCSSCLILLLGYTDWPSRNCFSRKMIPYLVWSSETFSGSGDEVLNYRFLFAAQKKFSWLVATCYSLDTSWLWYIVETSYSNLKWRCCVEGTSSSHSCTW